MPASSAPLPNASSASAGRKAESSATARSMVLREAAGKRKLARALALKSQRHAFSQPSHFSKAATAAARDSRQARSSVNQPRA